MKCIVISTNGSFYTVDIEKNGAPLYELMHKTVNGYYENVYPHRLKKGYAMIVNEEGLIENLPTNYFASYLYESEEHGVPIVGEAIILKIGKYHGESDVVALSDEEAERIIADFEEIMLSKTYKRIIKEIKEWL